MPPNTPTAHKLNSIHLIERCRGAQNSTSIPSNSNLLQTISTISPSQNMIRSFHFLGSAGVSPFHRWKKPLPLLLSPSLPKSRRTSSPTELPSSIATSQSSRCFRAFQMSASRSESDPDAEIASASSVLPSTAAPKPKINFCQSCGGSIKQVIPDGEEKMRAVCMLCGRIFYENPKMVVGCLVEHDNKVLLCRRKIQPSYGLWTLPAGFMEIGESAAEGATRETLEEACAEVEVLSPFAQLDIPLIAQSYIIFRANLKKPHFSPGPESLECALFPLEDIPFDSLAFSSIVVTLKMYIEDVKAGKFQFHYCIINKRPGASPSDTHAFAVNYHLHS